jgi:toxin ParE1/3/4
MKNLPNFSRLALADLHEILEYIARGKPLAGVAFVQKLRDKCSLLAENPELGEFRSELAENLRAFSVGNYVIFYRIVPNGVEIVRVVSGYRDLERLF